MIDTLYWDHKASWLRAGHEVSEKDGYFSIVFESISGDYGSDVGLDDVQLSPGPCNYSGV